MGRPLAGTVALMGLLAAACGGAEGPDAPVTQARSIRGVNVVLASDAPFTRAPDLDARIESTVEAALRYWGGSWAAVDGHTIRIVDAASVPCGASASLGCVEGLEIRVTSRDPGVGTVSCIEQTVLVHEIGHVVLGDSLHTDPRWMELDPLAAELSGRTGYAEDGPTACETNPSVWRHPLGTP